jgi:hypothetical protein
MQDQRATVKTVLSMTLAKMTQNLSKPRRHLNATIKRGTDQVMRQP